MVDFGLAQSYDKTSENIFNLESLSNKKITAATLANDSTPTRKNMIAISKKITSTSSSTSSAHLVLKNPKNPLNQVNQSGKNEANSLPHTPTKEKPAPHLVNSQSYENNLSEVNATTGASTTNPTAKQTNASPKRLMTGGQLAQSPKVNTPRMKSSTPNLQKYYSFQKPSYSFMDNKCTCFNMPFVCEICTTK